MCISHYLQDIPIIHPFQYASSQRFQFSLSTLTTILTAVARAALSPALYTTQSLWLPSPTQSSPPRLPRLARWK